MARAAQIKGPLTEDASIIRQAETEYLDLANHLDSKRAEQKIVTGGKTDWRRTCVERHVDPVILADAAEFKRKLQSDPEKATREWILFNQYAKAIGCFDLLVPGLFDDFEVRTDEIAA